MNNRREDVSIGIIGKYAGLQDSYLSLKQALVHGGVVHGVKVNFEWIEAEDLEKGRPDKILGEKDGFSFPEGSAFAESRGKSGLLHTPANAAFRFRDLPRDAMRHDRIRPQRRRAQGSEFGGIRPGRAP